jgi:hypothetical protein
VRADGGLGGEEGFGFGVAVAVAAEEFAPPAEATTEKVYCWPWTNEPVQVPADAVDATHVIPELGLLDNVWVTPAVVDGVQAKATEVELVAVADKSVGAFGGVEGAGAFNTPSVKLRVKKELSTSLLLGTSSTE